MLFPKIDAISTPVVQMPAFVLISQELARDMPALSLPHQLQLLHRVSGDVVGRINHNLTTRPWRSPHRGLRHDTRWNRKQDRIGHLWGVMNDISLGATCILRQ